MRRILNCTPAITLILFLVVSLVVVASDKNETFSCGSHYDSNQVIGEMSCSKASNVIILSEKHDDPMARRLGAHFEYIDTGIKDFFGFFEGQTSDYQYKNSFGIEDPLIESISNLQGASVIFDVLSNETPSEKASGSSLKYFANGKAYLLQAIFSELPLTGDFSWMDQNLYAEIFSKIEGSLHFNKISETAAWQNYANIQALKDTTSSFIKILINRFQSSSEYRAFNGDTERLMGEGRTLIFAENIVHRYCSLPSNKPYLWIQVGSAHAEELKCLLEKHLPKGSNVVIKSPNEYSQAYDIIDNFQTTNIFHEIQDYIAKTDSTILVSTNPSYHTLRNGKPEIFERNIGLSKKLSAETLSHIKEILQMHSLIFLRADFYDLKDFAESLSFTFDPTKI